jgi:hypothetical protein
MGLLHSFPEDKTQQTKEEKVMAKTTTVYFPIEISYKGADDSVEVRNYNLTLALCLEERVAEGSTCGEITINGAVIPIDDHPPVYQEGDGEVPLEAGGMTQDGDSLQKAA